MRGPCLFSDIGKMGRDLLEKDYGHGQRFTFSARCGCFMTTILQRNGLYISEIARLKYEKIINDAKRDWKSASPRKFSLMLKQISEVRSSNPALSPHVLGKDAGGLSYHTCGKLEVQCFHDYWSFAGAMDLNLSPTIDLSATVGVHRAVFGANAGFDTSTMTLTKWNLGLSLTILKSTYSLLLMDKGNILKQSLLYFIDGKQKFAYVVEATKRLSTNRQTPAVGCLFAWAPLTLKMTYGCKKFAVLLQYQAEPNAKLTISSEHDTRHMFSHPRLGLALAINL